MNRGGPGGVAISGRCYGRMEEGATLAREKRYHDGMKRPLVLASASPRRAKLLRDLGLDFISSVSRAEEAEAGLHSPKDVARINAYRKALAVSEAYPDALVLGADTVVAIGSRSYGKPDSPEAAAAMLSELSGRTHEVITGVCLSCACARELEEFVEITRVTFRKLSGGDISDYLARVHVLDKAGAYAIQEHGDALVQAVEGSFTNVVGLPVERLIASLSSRGFEVRSGAASV